jgi:hypothetical protein
VARVLCIGRPIAIGSQTLVSLGYDPDDDVFRGHELDISVSPHDWLTRQHDLDPKSRTNLGHARCRFRNARTSHVARLGDVGNLHFGCRLHPRNGDLFWGTDASRTMVAAASSARLWIFVCRRDFWNACAPRP